MYRAILKPALKALAGVFGLTLLLACGDPQPGKIVTHETACQPENNEQRLTIVGYLTADGMTFCSRGSCSLKLRKGPNAAKPAMTVGIRPGWGRNRMAKLPKRYRSADIKFRTNEDKELGNLAYVRVTGKALIGAACQLVNVNLIEVVK